MRKILFFCLFSGVLLAIISCNNDGKNPKELKKQTEAVHDEAMKELGGMNHIARSLRKELAQLDSLHQTGPRRDSINEVLSAMGKAEDDMMAWMAQYKVPADMAAKDAVEYLETQKKNIEQNKNDIKAAIERGKALAH